MLNSISIKNLQKKYNQTEVFRDLCLDIEAEKITAIFGPNGSGKSTLLQILSGLQNHDSGNYQIHGFDKFSFSYIFQDYRESLLPWRNCADNVALPLQIQKKNKEEINKKITELEKMFELKINYKNYPYELSGGQQQILAFMRALVTNPNILFIDEPFSALDYENNLRLRGNLQKYYLTYKPTIVIITHNIEEAVHLAHNIVILSKKPTKVIQTIINDVPHPRDHDYLKTDHFHNLKDEILSIFRSSAGL